MPGRALCAGCRYFCLSGLNGGPAFRYLDAFVYLVNTGIRHLFQLWHETQRVALIMASYAVNTAGFAAVRCFLE